ncbi:platelet glycoprotein Ib alpha chain [Erythrolamprus reginae]|uniref:platelet glycoprotein Ib alpha chain n=1 Tax=Erythrolamprus reginae TaxID=121349 RepID=UPI00396CE735
MLQGLLAPLLLLAAVVSAMLPPEQCKSEMNKIRDLLEVSCVEAGLTSIPGELPNETGILLLASNRLVKVALASFQHMPQLTVLDLSNNSLKTLETGATLPKLEHLYLSHNGLESLTSIQGLPSLKCLALGHNQLSQVSEGAFQELGQLEDLELQGNRLHGLPGAAFEGLKKLNDLDLSDNRLEELPQKLLAMVPRLKILRLERNRLERVPDGFFSGEEYGYIYLVGNPWVCDCRLDYLRKWINENEIYVYTRVTVQKGGVDEEITEQEPHKVLCHAPAQEKGKAVMNFQASCRDLGDADHEVEDEGPADSWTTPSPTPPPSMAAAPLTLRMQVASRPSSPSPSTAVSSTGAALTTTGSTSALSSMTHSPTTTSPGPATTTTILTTTAAFVTSGATAGRSTATSNDPVTTPRPSSTHVPTQPNTHVPTMMATSSTPLALSPTALLTTPLPSTPLPTVAGHPPSSVALVPSTPTPTHVKSSPRISAPLPTREISPPPPPKPSAHCLCPALPVRVLGVAARKGFNVEWMSSSCCLLRLVLYIACLALLALPTLALLCWLAWLHLGWYRPALRGAPGSRLARLQQWQEGPHEEWQPRFAEAPQRTAGPHIYRVCKKFQVASSRHVTWLLVSLPGPAGKWAKMQARLSSYSLDRGKDTLGAVRVKYAAASL